MIKYLAISSFVLLSYMVGVGCMVALNIVSLGASDLTIPQKGVKRLIAAYPMQGLSGPPV